MGNKYNPENLQNYFSVSNHEIPIISVGPYGAFHDYGSFAKCFCNQCSGRRVPFYTCKSESCKIKCSPHTRKCSKCGDHNYLARCRINRKYYDSRKSRLNSEDSISSINKSSDPINDMDLLEIWNNAWSEFPEHQ
ncbi:15069_t:CDS:1 [Cetraspora pellucida]|uniref:15069_t:CDS:1 n=1 Tax=Cetraspora pellucida TaxID=1433469 RepID=A0ACA9LTV9_9GLOM|nr:15069_t:CDS:1 [Cetraspora pellucida]